MNETEYHLLCDQWFERIENMLEEADLDFDSMGGVIEAELSSGAKMIINRQPATREVWVAEPNGGHHFAWQDGDWRHTRDERVLFDLLRQLIHG